MCVMEVHAGQRLSTMAQACAHNTNTIMGDVDLLETVLRGRGQHEAIRTLEQARERLRQAYAGFLGLFQAEVARAVQDHGGHVHDHEPTVGHERTLIEQAHHDATLARRFETR